jgi:hypothetical protein
VIDELRPAKYFAPLCPPIEWRPSTLLPSPRSPKSAPMVVSMINFLLRRSREQKGKKISFVAQVTVATTCHSISGQHNDKSNKKKKGR